MKVQIDSVETFVSGVQVFQASLYADGRFRGFVAGTIRPSNDGFVKVSVAAFTGDGGFLRVSTRIPYRLARDTAVEDIIVALVGG